MINGQAPSRAMPGAHEVVQHATESADALLQKVLEATAARRFSITDMQDMADTTARSGLYKMNGAQVFTLMMLCDAEGRHPAEALMIYHIFDNKVTMRADAMLAKFQRAGGRIQWIKDTLTECEALFSHPVHYPKPKTVSFTWEDAERAKLTRKENWQNHPRAMLRARVITAGIRMVLPGVIMGIYTPDELGDDAPATVPARELAPEDINQALYEDRPPREPRPTPGERTARTPVRETVANLEAHQMAHKAPTTEWGKWITEAVDDFNRELAMVSNEHPENLRLRVPLRPQQVANALITAGIEAGFIDESQILKPNGKRDPARVRRMLDFLWSDDPDWIIDQAGQYLARKLIELLPKQRAPETASEPDDRPASQERPA